MRLPTPLIILSYLILFHGCHKTYHIPENVILGSWVVRNSGYVKHNGADVTFAYPNISLNFSRISLHGPFDYGSFSAEPLFQKLGTWVWMGASLKQISLDNGQQVVDIDEVNDNILKLSFIITETYLAKQGKDPALAGEYQMLLEKVNQ